MNIKLTYILLVSPELITNSRVNGRSFSFSVKKVMSITLSQTGLTLPWAILSFANENILKRKEHNIDFLSIMLLQKENKVKKKTPTLIPPQNKHIFVNLKIRKHINFRRYLPNAFVKKRNPCYLIVTKMQ